MNYAKIENDKIVYRGQLPKNTETISGLDLADDTFLKTLGYLPIEEHNVDSQEGYNIEESVDIQENKVVITKYLVEMTQQEWEDYCLEKCQNCNCDYNSSCIYGNLEQQKNCASKFVNKIKQNKNNDNIYFDKDGVRYKYKLKPKDADKEQSDGFKLRALLGIWDEDNDKFKCTKSEDNSSQLILMTKNEISNFVKNCGKFQSNNLYKKENFLNLINNVETVDELHNINFENGWEDTLISIES